MIPMRKKRGGSPLPRRMIALCLAVAALWVISRTAKLAAIPSALFGNERIAIALLELELGKLSEEEPYLDGWTELVIDQSPLLASEKEAVEEYLRKEAEKPSEEEAADASVSVVEESPEPEQDPADTSGDTSEVEQDPMDEPAEESTPPPEPEKPEEKKEEKPPVERLDLSGISPEKISVSNHTENQSPSVSKYWKKNPSVKLKNAEKGPQILIMHTHCTEAYTMADGDKYKESDESRTTDENYNMVRVGEEMKAVFEDMGLSVVHDKTTYDYPGYNGSYGRSLEGVKSYLDKYPTIQVVLDVHRDALIDSDGTAYAKTTTIDGEKVAQVMLVVGTNDGGLTHPDWRKNYTLALKWQGAMLSRASDLPRPIDLRSQRFNQHLTTGSLLVEVGTSGNTLRQALAGARLFAQSAGQQLLDCVE